MLVQQVTFLFKRKQALICQLTLINTPLSYHLHTTCPHHKKRKTLIESVKNKFLDPADKNKRPSDLEIKQKDLPQNTPTLKERVNRDVEHKFYQADEKSGYHNLRKHPESFATEVIEAMKKDLKTNPKETFVDSFKTVANECKKFANETISNNKPSETLDKLPQKGDRLTQWEFTKEEDLEEWILTVDSEWGEGYSAAQLDLSGTGHAVFKGNLSTRVPADGRTQNAGYANICSVTKRKSFARVEFLDWMYYTHLTMNVRGDGRKYMINLHVYRDYDVTWNDRWHFPLYTRGGPYWQYVKIPWSKFYLGNRGYIQDRQDPVPLWLSTGMSITLADQITGPFQLEIKDIGVHCDPGHDLEEFAYEKYKIPSFWAGF